MLCFWLTHQHFTKFYFCKKSKVLRCLTNIVTLRFENLSTSSRCFSGSKDLSLDGLITSAECLRNGFPSKLYILKWMGRGQLKDHEQDGLILLRILVGTVWDFIQAKCSLCWLIKRCGGLIWSCCYHNLLGKADEEKRRILTSVCGWYNVEKFELFILTTCIRFPWDTLKTMNTQQKAMFYNFDICSTPNIQYPKIICMHWKYQEKKHLKLNAYLQFSHEKLFRL